MFLRMLYTKGGKDLKSREEIIDGITARFHGEMDGVWKNGYFHGVEDGKEDVKNKLEVIDEIKLGEYFKGYHDGLKEAWDAARRIREMLNTDWINVFGPQTCDPIDDLTAEDAIIKLKEWTIGRLLHQKRLLSAPVWK